MFDQGSAGCSNNHYLSCMMRRLAPFLGLVVLCAGIKANDSAKYRPRKFFLCATTSVLTVGSLAILDQAWYSEYHTGNFHLFNDNSEWLQMDKAGHAYSSYQTSRLMMEAFDWAGYSKKTTLLGGGIGFLYLSAVEVMDGFSRGWGFSWGDEFADAFGTALAITQRATWNEQKFMLKFSYHRSGLAPYNPSLLGENASSRILKDYNAQSYWLSFSPATLAKEKSFFPKWLCISLGYGAYGMLGGHENNVAVMDGRGNLIHYERVRRSFLSIDLDFSKFKTKRRWLRTVFSVLNVIKVPAPGLSFSQNTFHFHYLIY
jgi:hypothetical protein